LILHIEYTLLYREVANEKNVYFPALGWNVTQTYIKCICSIVKLNSHMTLLMFWLDGVISTDSGILKFLNLIVLSICVIRFYNAWYMYFCRPVLGA
jgi:hypothetical protein